MPLSARQHLDQAADRALEYYDTDGPSAAMAAFITEVEQHPGTAWIYDHPLTMMTLLIGAKGGQEGLKKAMTGFKVSEG